MFPSKLIAALFLSSTLASASCGAESAGDKHSNAASAQEAGGAARAENTFEISERGRFNEPWAMAFEPGTGNLFITEKRGAIRILQPSGKTASVTGVPRVDYGGQGGLGDFAFAPDYTTSRMVYLSWAEAGQGDTRGAAVGRARLVCEDTGNCELQGLKVIWRQAPKVTGRGHYSHRIAFSPDGNHLFIASGERQKMEPAQDISNNLGAIVRLKLDGTPAPGNPFTGRASANPELWSIGHRNILGLRFDDRGQLWDMEHGPRGGDELNLVKPGANYGWPVVSNGEHYNGKPIPNHATRPDFAAPAISWTPVIAPGDFLFYSGSLFPEWQGQALIAGLDSEALVRVEIMGAKAVERARYGFGARLRDIVQGPDGAIWIAEDGTQARLLKLTPRLAK
jgi:glucose/arabinose dehydrogenase